MAFVADSVPWHVASLEPSDGSASAAGACYVCDRWPILIFLDATHWIGDDGFRAVSTVVLFAMLGDGLTLCVFHWASYTGSRVPRRAPLHVFDYGASSHQHLRKYISFDLFPYSRLCIVSPYIAKFYIGQSAFKHSRIFIVLIKFLNEILISRLDIVTWIYHLEDLRTTDVEDLNVGRALCHSVYVIRMTGFSCFVLPAVAEMNCAPSRIDTA